MNAAQAPANAAAAAAARVELDLCLSRIGLGNIQRMAFDRYSGFIDINDFGNVSEKDISKTIKDIRTHGEMISLYEEKKILALRYLVLDNRRWQLDTNAADVQHIDVLTYLELKASHDHLKEMDTSDVSLPSPFKEPRQWRTFSDQFKEYLTQKYGEMCLMYTYLIRENQDPLALPPSHTNEEQRAATVPLEGEAYARENRQLFSWIKQLTIEGPAWPLISSFDKKQDGRSAYLTLNNHYLGGSAVNSITSAAASTLERIVYAGDRKNYSFHTFLNKFIQSYADLKNYGREEIHLSLIHI